MNTTEQMRTEISKVYGKKWKQKCLKMTTEQVVAIYKSFQKRGLVL